MRPDLCLRSGGRRPRSLLLTLFLISDRKSRATAKQGSGRVARPMISLHELVVFASGVVARTDLVILLVLNLQLAVSAVERHSKA